MKSLTCDICGAKGMVHKVMGKSENEVMDKMERHLKDVHRADYENMMSMPKADQDKMKEESRKRIVNEPKMTM